MDVRRVAAAAAASMLVALALLGSGCGSRPPEACPPYTHRAGTGCTADWPVGALLPLHVATGQVVTLTPGQVYDYESITIDDGAELRVGPGSGAAQAWTFVGSAGPITIHGTGRLVASSGMDRAGTFTARAPDADGALNGESVAYQVAVARGGSGGAGSQGCDNPGSGCQMFGSPGIGGSSVPGIGNGGGGGGGCNYHGYGSPTGGSSPVDGAGGAGGNGAGSAFAQGGSGATEYGADGQAGGDDTSAANGGGGGGGGHLGMHGQGLYIKVRSSLGIQGTGTISVAGGAGGAGGLGGGNHQYQTTLAYSGGGGSGGGGAGGSGGKIVVRLPRGAAAPTVQLDASGGPGGTGQVGGCNVANYGVCGTAGEPGASGPVAEVGTY